MPARRMTPRPVPERRKAPASPQGAGASPASKQEADAALWQVRNGRIDPIDGVCA